MKNHLIALLQVSLFLLTGCGQTQIYELNEATAVGVPYQEIPKGLTSINASACGDCHQAIYAEWRTTMHAAAYTDPFFQAYWKKDKQTWSCLTCHTPLENQLQRRITQFKNGDLSEPQFEPNRRFDAQLQQEGVTCAACHLRDGIIYGPYPAEQLNAPHPVAYDERFLSESICLGCHEVAETPFSLMRSGICGTGDEWKNGPYISQGYRCQTCHMPEVTRPLVSGMKSHKGGRHLWRGGNSPEQVAKALTIQVIPLDNRELRVDITNSGAGHKFPTGDPDREVFITAKLVNKVGRDLQTEALHIRRLIIWKPIMIELSDNRIEPLETRSLFLTLPSGQNQELTIEVEGIYQILSERARKKLETYYGLKDYPPVRYQFMQKKFDTLGHELTNRPLTTDSK
ncbi:MAG: cytochrome c family protein [Candidatus Polarisedimenticolaceae bacterium]|nr:cytochrome c family protein [Candidatus Polarisedimenticolaceae bacterium]